jgi:hypothetical protein
MKKAIFELLYLICIELIITIKALIKLLSHNSDKVFGKKKLSHYNGSYTTKHFVLKKNDSTNFQQYTKYCKTK